MIQSWSDYKRYYYADLKQTGIAKRSIFHRLKDRRYKFYRSLRRTEWIMNCHPGWHGIFSKLAQMPHTRLCNKYQWTILPNVFGEGLSIVHVGTIVVAADAKVGVNCRIHVCVNIGHAIAKGQSGFRSSVTMFILGREQRYLVRFKSEIILLLEPMRLSTHLLWKVIAQ